MRIGIGIGIGYGGQMTELARLFASASFFAPLTSNLTLSKGTGPLTSSRASTATVQAYAPTALPGDPLQTILCAANETRFVGARRISQGVWSETFADGTPIPATTLQGALVEPAATNLCLWSNDVSNPSWVKASVVVAAPVATQENTILFQGGSCSKVVFPAVTVGGAYSIFYQYLTAATQGIWMRGAVGGETLYMMETPNGATYTRKQVTLTTAFQYFELNKGASALTYWQIGVDLRDAGQTAKAAQTIYVANSQVEAGLVSTSYIPTTTAAVTRAADVLTVPTAGNLTAAQGWMYAEFTYYAGMGGWLCDSYTDASNYLGLSHASGTSVGLRKAVAGVITDAVSATALVSGTRYKLAGTWGSNGMSASLNGIALGSNASTTPAVLAATVQLNAYQTGGEQGTGCNHRFGTTQLTQAQLNAMTA